MRQSHPHVSLGILCGLFGVTRQAYHLSLKHAQKTYINQMIVLTLVKEIRQQLPLLGTRKLMHLLEPKLSAHGIKMGRDQLHSLLRFHELLIRRRWRKVRTTDSNHVYKRYPNLIPSYFLTTFPHLTITTTKY